jgi:histone-lysine N-methyltransferase SETD7
MTEEGPWYLVAGGWQGAFFYEAAAQVEGSRSQVGVYFYPDFTTVIVGLWEDHLLVQGQASSLTHACFSEAGWTLRFGDLSGPTVAYSPPSHYSLGAPPTLKDPMESVTVEVEQSRIPGAASGLFLKRAVIAGEVVAFYSGFIIHCESSLRALDRRELSNDAEHERNMYNLALDLPGEEENLCIDIPTDMGNNVSMYNATLGHKVNHSFEPNSEFILFSAHPIFGTVMALAAMEDMLPGQELTVNYGYNFTAEPEQPPWFVEQWKAFYSKSNSSCHQEL